MGPCLINRWLMNNGSSPANALQMLDRCGLAPRLLVLHDFRGGWSMFGQVDNNADLDKQDLIG